MKIVDVEQVFCADCEFKDKCDEVCCDVKAMPTLDYKDLIPKAEWEFVRADENDMIIYRCTNCKTKRYGRPLFCSQCGAKMSINRRESDESD